MQDRFKFRIFDKKLNKMSNWGDNPYHNMEIMNYICVDTPVTDWKHEDYVLMQSTGLKDKNNNLIYEGDIVKFTDNITINGLKTHISVVEHNKEHNAYMYHADCMGLYTINPSQNKLFKVEVIGNIYENKDLLKETKQC